MYEYMKKAEHYHSPTQELASAFDIHPTASDYGSSGPVQVSFTKYAAKISEIWISALESLGVPSNEHPLAGNNIGASQQPSDINPANSSRSYSAAAYLFPNAGRKNLAVLTSALVERINWASSKGGNVVASGVTFTSGGQEYTVAAKKEVIISGGSINTPQLLELSGIGSKSVLAQAGVKQVVDLANVGENLQDHTYAAGAWERKDSGVTLDSIRNNATFAQQQAALYASNATSILDESVPSIAYISLSTLVGNDTAAKALIAEAAAYVQSSNAPYKATLEQQIVFLEKYPNIVSQMELIALDGFFVPGDVPSPNKTYTTLLAPIQHILSRGSIHIN